MATEKKESNLSNRVLEFDVCIMIIRNKFLSNLFKKKDPSRRGSKRNRCNISSRNV